MPTIDGELQPYTNVNYILRGMEIPKGEHIIKFKFEPSVIKTGSIISLISYALNGINSYKLVFLLQEEIITYD